MWRAALDSGDLAESQKNHGQGFDTHVDVTGSKVGQIDEGTAMSNPAESPNIANRNTRYSDDELMQIASEILDLHNTNGGSTYSLHHGDMATQPFYAVCVFPEDNYKTVLDHPPTPQDLVDFIKKHMDLLQHPRLVVGTWNEQKPGVDLHWLEISSFVPARGYAEHLGMKYNQIGIVDLSKIPQDIEGAYIPTGGTGEGVPDLPPIEQRLKELEGEEKIAGQRRRNVAPVGPPDPSETEKLAIVSHPEYYNFTSYGDTTWKMNQYQQAVNEMESVGHSFEHVQPQPVTPQEASLVHTPEYVEDVFGNPADSKKARGAWSGGPWDESAQKAVTRSAGGSIQTMNEAQQRGIAVNMYDAFHHAYPAHGEGFCVLNDVAIAAKKFSKQGRKVMVIDTDVHQGQGTAVSTQDDPNVFTLSMHEEQNYPGHKEKSSLDIGYEWKITDDEFMQKLQQAVTQALNKFGKPAIVFYIAGTDMYGGDRLGHTKVTMGGLRRRDEYVFGLFGKLGIPVAVSIPQGYAKYPQDTVKLLQSTVREAQKALNRYYGQQTQGSLEHKQSDFLPANPTPPAPAPEHAGQIQPTQMGTQPDGGLMYQIQDSAVRLYPDKARMVVQIPFNQQNLGGVDPMVYSRGRGAEIAAQGLKSHNTQTGQSVTLGEFMNQQQAGNYMNVVFGLNNTTVAAMDTKRKRFQPPIPNLDDPGTPDWKRDRFLRWLDRRFNLAPGEANERCSRCHKYMGECTCPDTEHPTSFEGWEHKTPARIPFDESDEYARTKEDQEHFATMNKQAYIRHHDGKWTVMSESGKEMGTYESEFGAKKRLRQVEYFKHKKGSKLTGWRSVFGFPTAFTPKTPESFDQRLDDAENYIATMTNAGLPPEEIVTRAEGELGWGYGKLVKKLLEEELPMREAHKREADVQFKQKPDGTIVIDVSGHPNAPMAQNPITQQPAPLSPDQAEQQNPGVEASWRRLADVDFKQRPDGTVSINVAEKPGKPAVAEPAEPAEPVEPAEPAAEPTIATIERIPPEKIREYVVNTLNEFPKAEPYGVVQAVVEMFHMPEDEAYHLVQDIRETRGPEISPLSSWRKLAYPDPAMLPEYDFSKGERGKYVDRIKEMGPASNREWKFLAEYGEKHPGVGKDELIQAFQEFFGVELGKATTVVNEFLGSQKPPSDYSVSLLAGASLKQTAEDARYFSFIQHFKQQNPDAQDWEVAHALEQEWKIPFERAWNAMGAYTLLGKHHEMPSIDYSPGFLAGAGLKKNAQEAADAPLSPIEREFIAKYLAEDPRSHSTEKLIDAFSLQFKQDREQAERKVDQYLDEWMWDKVGEKGHVPSYGEPPKGPAGIPQIEPSDINQMLPHSRTDARNTRDQEINRLLDNLIKAKQAKDYVEVSKLVKRLKEMGGLIDALGAIKSAAFEDLVQNINTPQLRAQYLQYVGMVRAQGQQPLSMREWMAQQWRQKFEVEPEEITEAPLGESMPTGNMGDAAASGHPSQASWRTTILKRQAAFQGITLPEEKLRELSHAVYATALEFDNLIQNEQLGWTAEQEQALMTIAEGVQRMSTLVDSIHEQHAYREEGAAAAQGPMGPVRTPIVAPGPDSPGQHMSQTSLRQAAQLEHPAELAKLQDHLAEAMKAIYPGVPGYEHVQQSKQLVDALLGGSRGEARGKPGDASNVSKAEVSPDQSDAIEKFIYRHYSLLPREVVEALRKEFKLKSKEAWDLYTKFKAEQGGGKGGILSSKQASTEVRDALGIGKLTGQIDLTSWLIRRIGDLELVGASCDTCHGVMIKKGDVLLEKVRLEHQGHEWREIINEAEWIAKLEKLAAEGTK